MPRATTRRRNQTFGMSRNLRQAMKAEPETTRGFFSLEHLQMEIASHCNRISAMFPPECKVTVLVRHPVLKDADVCVTDDEFVDLAAMIARCAKREQDQKG